jgi:hypothetical protein
MSPGHAVEKCIEENSPLAGIPLGNFYQHEYREIDVSFPYQDCTLSQLGIPAWDVLHVVADRNEYYLEMKKQ